MKKYRLQEYDVRLLKEARAKIMVVVTYHFGAPHSGPVTKRLETILAKLDYLIAQETE